MLKKTYLNYFKHGNQDTEYCFIFKRLYSCFSICKDIDRIIVLVLNILIFIVAIENDCPLFILPYDLMIQFISMMVFCSVHDYIRIITCQKC